MTYTQAVEKACNGDSPGFEFLYDTTKNNKYYLALKYVKDEEAAKDIAAMANSGGGWIVFGVKESGDTKNRKNLIPG